MAAPPGNRFWEARSSHGRNPIFATPEELWDACVEYFEWNEENPLYEAKPFSFQGDSWTENVAKMRVMTLASLQLFLQISDTGWRNYKARQDFVDVCNMVEKSIREQKFAGASAGLFNPMIIARDLGLKENTEIDHRSGDGSMTPKNALDASKLSNAALTELMELQNASAPTDSE
ncbi:MAG: terminase small subunit [Pseudomonadota bacterium]